VFEFFYICLNEKEQSNKGGETKGRKSYTFIASRLEEIEFLSIFLTLLSLFNNKPLGFPTIFRHTTRT
jgi:hypothetical protein